MMLRRVSTLQYYRTNDQDVLAKKQEGAPIAQGITT